jgi:hypothetical protein
VILVFDRSGHFLQKSSQVGGGSERKVVSRPESCRVQQGSPDHTAAHIGTKKFWQKFNHTYLCYVDCGLLRPRPLVRLFTRWSCYLCWGLRPWYYGHLLPFSGKIICFGLGHSPLLSITIPFLFSLCLLHDVTRPFCVFLDHASLQMTPSSASHRQFPPHKVPK